MRIILLFLILSFTNLELLDINSVINKVESDIIKLRDIAEKAFKERCVETKKCSYHSCSSDLPLAKCNPDFLTVICSCYKPSGSKLILNEFTVTLADVFPPKIDPEDPRVKGMVRTGQKLNPYFKMMSDNNSKLYKWMYFGTSNGVFMTYPGHCTNNYDNRYI